MPCLKSAEESVTLRKSSTLFVVRGAKVCKCGLVRIDKLGLEQTGKYNFVQELYQLTVDTVRIWYMQ